MDSILNNFNQDQNLEEKEDFLDLKEENSKKIKNIYKENLSKKVPNPKRQKMLNNFRHPLKIYMSLFVIVLFLVFITAQGEPVSQPSSITLRFNKTGVQRVINTTFYKFPDKIYINGELSESNNILVNINNVSDTVKLEWNDKLTSCKDMFRDCTEVALIDLSDFDSSSVKDTSSMFRNCNLLT